MKSFMVRDERETNVDQAADRLSYLVVSFGLLLVVAVRSAAGREAPWDLLGLVIVGGLVGTGYRAWRRTVSPRWVVVGLAAAAVAFVVAVAVSLATRA